MSLHIEIRPPATRNALYLGDDLRIDGLLASVLKSESWNLQRASGNSSALQLVQGRYYDLIVTSEKTAGRENVELLRKIWSLGSQPPVIILSSKNTTTDVIAAIREHAFSYFSQPFSSGALQRMIRLAIGTTGWDDGIEVVSVSQPGLRFRARCDFETADRLLQFLQEIEALPDPERAELATASHELLYNAIEYGGKLDPTNHIEIEYARSRDRVTCRITDHGPGFRFDQIPHAAIANPADDPTHHIDVRQQQGMRPGGYGIWVARQLVDELAYGKNGSEVLLVKYLGSSTFCRPDSEGLSTGLPQTIE